MRVDWRDPAQQAREGFHRTWFNWGGLDGEVDVRAIGESELSEPTMQTTLTPDTPDGRAGAACRVSVQVHNYGPSRTIAPEGSLVHGCADDPAELPRASTLGHGQAATDTAHRDRRRPGAVVADQPQPLPADARGRRARAATRPASACAS